MSRGARVGYPFRAVPKDIAPEWFELPFATRMLGVAVWMLTDGEPIAVPQDWAKHICRELLINGPERPNVTRQLYRLQGQGLIRVCDGSATCLLRVCRESAVSLPPVCDGSAEPKSAKSLNSHFTDKTRQDRQDKTTARAPEPFRPSRRPLPEAPPDLQEVPEQSQTKEPDPLEREIILTWKRSQPDGGACARETASVTRSAAELAKLLRDNLRGHSGPSEAFQAAWKRFAEDQYWRAQNLPIRGLLTKLDTFHPVPEREMPKLEMHRPAEDLMARFARENAEAERRYREHLATLPAAQREALEEQERQSYENASRSRVALMRQESARKPVDELARRRALVERALGRAVAE